MMSSSSNAPDQDDAAFRPPTPPMILPYPSAKHPNVERFSFPELPEPNESTPTSAPLLVWPKLNDVELARAYAAAASKLLGQLSLERPAVVALTSPGDGDGKTSLLVGLAPQLTRRIAGSMLVVDANLQKPDLSLRLGLPPGKASSSALIYPTHLPRLNVLPAVHTSHSRSFDRTAIEDFREGWQLTLLDMPSLSHNDVIPTARFCDGVCLVTRLGYTSQRALSESARVLSRSGIRMLGCVVIG